MNAYEWIGTIKRINQRTAKNGNAFYNFSIFNEATGYVDCVCFTESGSAIKEGDEVELTNYIVQNRSYMSNDGTKKYRTSILVNQFEIMNKQPQSVSVDGNLSQTGYVENVAKETVNWDDDVKAENNQGVGSFEEFKKQYQGMASDESIVEMWEWKKLKGEINGK